MTPLAFVKNAPEYYEFIRELRLDPAIISGFVSQQVITKEQQMDYMRAHGKDYYICLLRGVPIGFIGVVNGDLRLAVKSEYQRKGVASFMLSELSKIVPVFSVRVKRSNARSLVFFEKNGFVQTDIVDREDCVTLEKKQ
jgi:GNAT superfamily N-acetyltransferase